MDGWIIKQAEEHFHNRKLYTTSAIYEAINVDLRYLRYYLLDVQYAYYV